MTAIAKPRTARAMKGFSLIEVLVALTIVAVALAACVRAAGNMAGQHAAMRDRTLALMSAQNTLAEIRATATFPALGQARTACSQGTRVLICEQVISATANRSFRQITVRVLSSDDSAPLAVLRGLASAWP